MSKKTRCSEQEIKLLRLYMEYSCADCACSSQMAPFAPSATSTAAVAAVVTAAAITITAATRRAIRIRSVRNARRSVREALGEARLRQRPISDLYSELSPVGRPEANARRFSCIQGSLKSQVLVQAPITKQECVIFSSAILQKSTGGRFRTKLTGCQLDLPILQVSDRF
jgi:type II secretory pathway pseudopilin PulG